MKKSWPAIVPLIVGIAAIAIHMPGYFEYLIGGKGGALLPGLGAAWLVGLALAFANPRLGIAFGGFGSAAAGGYLFWHKIAAAAADPICTVDNYMDCGAVNDSAASEVLGIPISLLGAALYGGIALASLANKEQTPNLFKVTAWLMVPSLLYSGYLSYVAYFQIHALCLFCLSMYFGNVAITLASLRGMQADDQDMMTELGPAFSGRAATTMALVFVVGSLVGVVAWTGRDDGGLTTGTDGLVPLDALAGLYTDVRTPIPLDGSEPVLGDPNAPYTIVEWADFACPHCAHAAESLDALVHDNPEIQVRFKPFPLSGDCSEAVQDGVIMDPRCRGAVAAECAHRQGKFWPFAHAVFKNLGYLEFSDLEFHAESKGLDVDAWRTCMMDPSAVSAVVGDWQAGQDVGVNSTPTLFILGLRDNPVQFMSGNHDQISALAEAVSAGRSLPPGTAPPRG